MKFSLEFDNISKFMLLCLIWYVEFCVRFFQYANTIYFLGAILFIGFFCSYLQNIKTTEFPVAIKIYLVYIAYSIIIGYFVSPDKSTHVAMSIRVLNYTILMIATVYFSQKDNNIDFLLKNYIILYTIICLIFLYSPILYKGDEFNNRLTYAEEMNPNTFGMDMVMATWVLFFLYTMKRVRIEFVVILTILFSYSILLCGSRKGFIGQAICISCCIPLLLIRRKKMINIFSIGIGLLVIAFLLFTYSETIINIYDNTVMSTRIDKLDNEFESGSRRLMYEFGTNLFKQNPVFGLGFQGFSSFFGGYSHATLVEIPVSGGIIGSILYFLFMINIAYNFIKIIFKKNYIHSTNYRFAFVLFIINVFYCSALIHIYEFNSYITFGIIISMYSLSYRDNKNAQGEEERPLDF